MADKDWIGSDGVWDTAGNWSPPGVPVTGDRVFLTDRNDVAITTGLNQSAVKLALLFIGDGFTKDVREVAANLVISSTLIIHRGKGRVDITNGTAVTDEIIVSHTGNQLNRSLIYSIGSSGGAHVTTFAITRGRVLIKGVIGKTFTNVFLAHAASRDNDADVEFDATFGTITNLHMAGGKFIMPSGIEGGEVENYIINGGTCTVENVGSASKKVYLGGGGRLNWDSGAVLTEANIYDGVLDFRQTRDVKTITTTRLWPNGEFRYYPDLTTLTNPIQEFDGRSVAP